MFFSKSLLFCVLLHADDHLVLPFPWHGEAWFLGAPAHEITRGASVKLHYDGAPPDPGFPISRTKASFARCLIDIQQGCPLCIAPDSYRKQDRAGDDWGQGHHVVSPRGAMHTEYKVSIAF